MANIIVNTDLSNKYFSDGIKNGKDATERSYRYFCNKTQIIGLIALVCAAALLIIAVVFGVGVFGGGIKGFIAGALTIGSMMSFAIAAFFLASAPPQAIHKQI